MPSVLDAIDRLNYTANSLHSIALKSQREDIGSFTQAVLYSSLQHIIREADETEYNLFTFVNDAGDIPLEGQGRLGRKEFKTATPLKTRRATKDEEPEIYLEAALRYLDGFHTIKPLPGMRAHLQSLVERLNNARDQLEEVEESIQLVQKKSNYSSSNTQIREEERRINELKVNILHLKKRKSALIHTINPKEKQLSQSSTKIACLQRKKDLTVDMPVHATSPPSRPESRSSIIVPLVPPTSNQENKTSDPSLTKTEIRPTHVTPIMERISDKIWNTIADILLPGNNFSQTGKVPDAKDTLRVV